jgi:hypothetical protein
MEEHTTAMLLGLDFIDKMSLQTKDIIIKVSLSPQNGSINFGFILQKLRTEN